MSTAIFAHALKEASRFRRVAPWLLIGVCCFLLAFNWKNFVPSAGTEDSYVSVISLLAVRVLALGSAILTTAVIGQEIEGRTIVYLLTRPVPRPLLLIVRFAASVLVVFVLAAVAFVFTSVGAYGSLGANPFLGRDLGVVALGALAYGALFLFVSLAVNRALIWCVLFAFGWETAVPSMPGDIYRASILSHLNAAMAHPKMETGGLLDLLGGSSAISAGSGVVTLLVLSAALLALSMWWFTKFEFVPREDAE